MVSSLTLDMQKSIFADATYSKPFFITFFDSSFFILPLVLFLPRHLYLEKKGLFGGRPVQSRHFPDEDESERRKSSDSIEDGITTSLLRPTELEPGQTNGSTQKLAYVPDLPPMTVRETMILGVKFSFLWFISNYLAAACLQHTTVASQTVLTSTSSVFTLVFGVLWHVESFTTKKLLGVLMSVVGIILISRVDTSGNDAGGDRGRFPFKPPHEIAIGDAMALASAICYGVYTVAIARSIGSEGRINMPLFFGFVGTANICLFPLLAILHWTGYETFEWPQNGKVWSVVLANALGSMIGDMAWGYAVLLTSPLVVTVGLSMTIPLSLVGEFILNAQYTGPLYWVGASIVLGAFVLINLETDDVPLQTEAPAIRNANQDNG